MIEFNKYVNYIGSNHTQKKFTKIIANNFISINKSAFYHDMCYVKLYYITEIKLILYYKMKADCNFLIDGFVFTTYENNPIIGTLGMLIVLILFLLIVLWTPFYYYRNLRR